jgi:hypothetical protein
MTRACDMYNETDMYNQTCCDDGDCFELENTTMICQSRTCVHPGNPRFTLRWYGGRKSAENSTVDEMLDTFILSSPHMTAFSQLRGP